MAYYNYVTGRRREESEGEETREMSEEGRVD